MRCHARFSLLPYNTKMNSQSPDPSPATDVAGEPSSAQVPQSMEAGGPEKTDSSSTPPQDAAPASETTEASEVAPADEATQPPVIPADLPQRIEALLMATDRAIPATKLSELLGKVGAKPVHQAIVQLNELYTQTQRSFRIESLAGGYQILTLPQYAEVVTALRKSRESAKLTPAGIETLAIVAYRQPITRAQIEAIRGVASGEVLRSLMERHLIKIVGRAEELGRPMLYGTTKAFLETFGLASLKDLPRVEELKPKA